MKLSHFAILLALAVTLTGCATVAPALHEHQEPSWDGNKQNSGIVTANVRTPHWLDRYNALIAAYGNQFKPALTANEGITIEKDGTIWANHFARVHFFIMNGWEFSAMHAPKTLLQKAGVTR